MDMVAEPEFAEAFFDRLTETIITAQRLFLDEVGDLIDIHFAADDLTGQAAPLISPALYRRMINRAGRGFCKRSASGPRRRFSTTAAAPCGSSFPT